MSSVSGVVISSRFTKRNYKLPSWMDTHTPNKFRSSEFDLLIISRGSVRFSSKLYR